LFRRATRYCEGGGAAFAQGSNGRLKTLGLTVPQSIFDRADKLID
jgi:hypothetical protein